MPIPKLTNNDNKKGGKKEMQIKTLKVANIKADAQENIISGYASYFNNKDSHGDIITKGAFTKTIQENKNRIKVLWQHDLREPIGKPIDMLEDEKGLFTTSKISQTETGKKAMILARDGVLNEMSIGFYPIKEDYDNEKNANMIREIKLMEYSLVTLASNPLAQLTDVKHLLNFLKQFQQFLEPNLHFSCIQVDKKMFF